MNGGVVDAVVAVVMVEPTEMALHYQMSEVLHDLDIGMATNDLKVLLPTLNTATSLGMESSTNLHVVSYAVGCV